MNEEHTSPMTPLDQMLAQDSLQMLKAAVPYFPAGAQRIFALYAKMMELSHTITMFSGGPAELTMMSEQPRSSQPRILLPCGQKFFFVEEPTLSAIVFRAKF